jgi:hypothetical protein
LYGLIRFFLQANQLLAQYLALRRVHEAVYLPALFHRAFSGLDRPALIRHQERVRLHLVHGEYGPALAACRQYIDLILAGVDYYQRYQRGLLQLLITATFLGSLATNLAVVLRLRSSRQQNGPAVSHRAEAVMAVVLLGAWFCQRLPTHFLLYYLAPVWTVYRLRTELVHLGPLKSVTAWPAIRRAVPIVGLAFVLCETVVAAFFERKALCLGLIITGATFLR